MAPTSDALKVAVRKPHAAVMVQGRATFKTAPALKQFGAAALAEGCTILVLDMRDCVGMDSTFMGVLAGLALRVRTRNQGETAVVNLSSKNLGLLETLGLTRLMRVHLLQESAEGPSEAGAAGEVRLDMAPDKRLTSETMLAAHETLVEIDPANLPKFQDVLAYLREDLKSAGDAEPKP